MAHKVIILYRLYMPYYFLGTFTEYPYENASVEYSGTAIKALVEELRAKGWVITYIGANQDVEKVASAISVTNVMDFQSTHAGTSDMFCKERRARARWFDRLSKGISEVDGDFFKEE